VSSITGVAQQGASVSNAYATLSSSSFIFA
jgi:hypothetical protein